MPRLRGLNGACGERQKLCLTRADHSQADEQGLSAAPRVAESPWSERTPGSSRLVPVRSLYIAQVSSPRERATTATTATARAQLERSRTRARLTRSPGALEAGERVQRGRQVGASADLRPSQRRSTQSSDGRVRSTRRSPCWCTTHPGEDCPDICAESGRIRVSDADAPLALRPEPVVDVLIGGREGELLGVELGRQALLGAVGADGNVCLISAVQRVCRRTRAGAIACAEGRTTAETGLCAEVSRSGGNDDGPVLVTKPIRPPLVGAVIETVRV